MPKRKSWEIPEVKIGKNGDFFVNFSGRKIYLGRDELSAKRKYMEVLALVSNAGTAESSPEKKKKVQRVLVQEVILDYLLKTKEHPKVQKIRRAMEALRNTYGHADAADFGRVKFQAVRRGFVQENLALSYINELMRFVIGAFELGVENEKIPESVAFALRAVRPLRKGEARTPAPREDVADEDVLKTLPFLSKTVRDMVVIQRLTGMRPSEVFQMRMADIEMSGEVWIYKPQKSKSERYHKRVVGLGELEQTILNRRFAGKQKKDFLFTPADSVRDRWQRQDCDGRYLSQLKEMYSKDSYRRAIVRGIEKARRAGADVRDWTPYQLRHAGATAISKLLGRSAAMVTLGHTSEAVTRVYDHSDLEKIREITKQRDQLGKDLIQKFV